VLDNYYFRSWTRDGLRSGPLGPFLDDFVTHLASQGYSDSTVRKSIRFLACLGCWLREVALDVTLLDEAALDRFATELPGRPYVRANRAAFKGLRPATERLLSWLRMQGFVASKVPAAPPADPLIGSFEDWMLRHRRVADVTLEFSYRPFLIRFLACVGRAAETYTAATIRGFILEQAGQYSRSSVQTGTSAIRMFLRYLATEGRCSPDLVAAVPTVPRWRKEVLPQWINPSDVERIISTCAGQVGCRDRAILLLLARLGLRAGDVRGLRLSDLDWTNARIAVCGKGQRREMLPLPQDVGDAILDYVLHIRPRIDGDHVFVTANAPYHSLGASAVSTIVVRASARAHVVLPRGGAHVFRHSLATALLADGVSLAGIGSVLRHKDLDTTRIYAKVDAALLSTVARPWPLEVTA